MVRSRDGNVIRLADVATIRSSVRNSRAAGWFNKDPSVLLIVTKQGDANVIDTVDRIYAMLPEMRQWIPAAVEISVLADRTNTIRASVHDMQLTLIATIILVMLVVFVFLRRGAATIAAGITVPLSLAGTCALMWVAGFSINNVSLMALVVAVGFVVDDAIVMIENMFRNLERGYVADPRRLHGRGQIGFTVISISVSLIAAFIPLLFMGGIIGRLFREFSVTLTFAIAVSTVVSLTVTPMICAYFVRSPPSKNATRLDRVMEYLLGHMVRFYARTLDVVLEWRALTMLVFARHHRRSPPLLYVKTPKGFFPQEDTGLLFGGTQASTDISFEAMRDLQQQAMDIVLADPAVAGARLFGRRLRLQLLGQSRPAVHQPQAVQRARRRAGRAGRGAAAHQAHGNPRAARVSGAGAGPAGGRPDQRLAISVHLVGPGHRRAQRVGAARSGPHQGRFPASPTSTPIATRAACKPMW